MGILEGIRPEVLFAAQKMEEKLRMNDHKPGWDDCPNKYFINRLHEEYREFRDEVYITMGRSNCIVLPDNIIHEKSDDIPITEEMVSEAIDVMDFCMMLICRKYEVKCSRKKKGKLD